MPVSEFAQGDVVCFPEGPFWDVCGVVQDVDRPRGRVRIDIREGLTHREGGVLRVRKHSLTARFEEIQLA